MERKIIHIKARPTLSNINYVEMLKKEVGNKSNLKETFTFNEAKFLPSVNYESDDEDNKTDDEEDINIPEKSEKSEGENSSEHLEEDDDVGYEFYEEDDEENFSD